MKYIYTTLLLLVLQGCGGWDETTTQIEQAVVIVEMIPGKSYTVYKGDKLVKTSDDAQVSILKNTQDDTSSVTLTQGSANIIRK